MSEKLSSRVRSETLGLYQRSLKGYLSLYKHKSSYYYINPLTVIDF